MSTFWWRVMRQVAWAAVRIYYGSFKVVGTEHVPAKGPVLLVINHPNSLLDAAAVLAAIPRPVRFGAKAPLFATKLWGPVLRRLGGIPVHRRQDAGSDPAKNQDTYAAFIQGLHDGDACAIFPEGFSHTEPALQYVKAGAVRIAVAAEEEFDGELDLAIVPVGLSFRPAQAFRGDAYVRVGEPFSISDLAGLPREESIPAGQTRIRGALEPLMLHLERPDLEPLIRDLASLYQSEQSASVGRIPRAEVERVAGQCLNHFLSTDPTVVDDVTERHDTYVALSTEAGSRDALALRERPVGWFFTFLRICLELICGFPLYVFGVLTSYVPGRLTDRVARAVIVKQGGDAALPVTRVVVGGFAFGLFWGLLAWVFHDWSREPIATGVFVVVMFLAALYSGRYRRHVRAWRRRALALGPAFLRKRALVRATVAKRRLLWLLNEVLLRYQAETGESILPSEAEQLRKVEQAERRTFARRRIATAALALAVLWVVNAAQPRGLQDLAEAGSPWMNVSAEAAPESLERDAAALAGYLDALTAIDAVSDELRADFREGRRDYYDPHDTSVQDALSAFLTCREGLFRIAWYYQRTPEGLPPDVAAKAFVLAHTATVELCARGMQFVDTFDGDSEAVRKLNEMNARSGVPEGTYDEIRAGLADPIALRALQDGVGRFGGLLHAGQLPTEEPWAGLVGHSSRGARVVSELSERVAEYRFEHGLMHTVKQGDVGRYAISAVVSTWIGDARVRKRDHLDGLVSAEQLDEIRLLLRPGDIILERRNWFLSNAFLPGYWPHAALYVGGVEGARELGIADDPRVAPHLAELAKRDKHGDERMIIEAQSDGVVFTSLEYSVGGADAVCVMRTRFPADKVAEAVATAFSHVGKPYDFDFDFFSTDKLVCTEVVWQAYGPKLGVELQEIAGRKTLPALQFVESWHARRGTDRARLDVVTFYDADESKGHAFLADEAALIDTIGRPGLVLLDDDRGWPNLLTPQVLALVALSIVVLVFRRRE